jgi:hypothetical protein
MSCCLNKLFEFLVIFYRITAHKFILINMNAISIVYYVFLYQYEDSNLHKIKFRRINNYCLKILFEVF